ncbi:tRNA (guanine37-N1)-methyltransferase [Fusobacterium naviforme]|nr:tRNA (guanosine(37)-N1)-methyltransferase TrmD [Fusobacterium naviforme]PSL09250.1 tRNA (guanine37-N1)-methyltransferase [Fusobacterium naviforme]STO27761.1 tRNA (guanine-N(1)-)-methyltransferase [Fusobacterium naviforme]
MKISVLTICPELFQSFLASHVVQRALSRGLAELEIVDIRSYAGGSFRHIDDSPYGGGRGLVLRCKPVLDALAAVCGDRRERCLVTALTPAGGVYSQKTARRYAVEEHLVLICGHYEGMDERILSRVDETVSVGDYVLTGGELPAMVVMDSVLRLLKGNLKEGSAEEESFENGLLEYPQYTQPSDFQGDRVPAVLLSGHHENIQRWRKKESLRITLERRPDLLRARELSEEEQALLGELRRERERR